MQDPSGASDRHARQLSIICSAIFGGVVTFAGVVWYLLYSGTYTPGKETPVYLGTVMSVAGLILLVGAQALPILLPPLDRGAALEEALAIDRRNTILGFALREGAAFLALVGALLTGRMAGGFAVAALALLAMAFAWPRRDRLDRT